MTGRAAARRVGPVTGPSATRRSGFTSAVIGDLIAAMSFVLPSVLFWITAVPGGLESRLR
jgi:hypothetical protein